MNPSIFKASDIRGIYPTEINTSVAHDVALACIQLLKPGKIVVAHDARHGSKELAQVVVETIAQESKNHEVVFVGLSTSPMFYFLVCDLNASGGCMITASHNPKEYNGFKTVGEKAELIKASILQETITSLNKK